MRGLVAPLIVGFGPAVVANEPLAGRAASATVIQERSRPIHRDGQDLGRIGLRGIDRARSPESSAG